MFHLLVNINYLNEELTTQAHETSLHMKREQIFFLRTRRKVGKVVYEGVHRSKGHPGTSLFYVYCNTILIFNPPFIAIFFIGSALTMTPRPKDNCAKVLKTMDEANATGSNGIKAKESDKVAQCQRLSKSKVDFVCLAALEASRDVQALARSEELAKSPKLSE